MKNIIILALLILHTSAARSQTIVPNEYLSLVDGEKIKTKVSSEFIKKGKEWFIGSSDKIDLNEAIKKTKKALEAAYEGEWEFADVSIQSFNVDENQWFMVMMFRRGGSDFATVILNMSSEIWPLGKRHHIPVEEIEK